MANQEHINLLKQGVEVWNQWRIEHGDIQPDLSGANLFKASLAHANLGEVDLRGANLFEARLYQADLFHANLGEADLRGANLFEARLYKVDFTRANLSNSPYAAN